MVDVNIKTSNGNKHYNSLAHSYKEQSIFWWKKKENLPIIQPSLQFFGIVLEKPIAKEWHGCHFKNCLFVVDSSTLRINYETNSSDQ